MLGFTQGYRSIIVCALFYTLIHSTLSQNRNNDVVQLSKILSSIQNRYSLLPQQNYRNK